MPGKAASEKELGMLQGKLNDFPQGFFGFGQSPHIRKACSGILGANDLLQTTISKQQCLWNIMRRFS
jgi:hypothetical protein